MAVDYYALDSLVKSIQSTAGCLVELASRSSWCETSAIKCLIEANKLLLNGLKRTQMDWYYGEAQIPEKSEGGD